MPTSAPCIPPLGGRVVKARPQLQPQPSRSGLPTSLLMPPPGTTGPRPCGRRTTRSQSASAAMLRATDVARSDALPDSRPTRTARPSRSTAGSESDGGHSDRCTRADATLVATTSEPSPGATVCVDPRRLDTQVEPVEQRPTEPGAVRRQPLLAGRCTRARDRRDGHTDTGSSRATTMQRDGITARPHARAISTRPSSSGTRSASSAGSRELGQLVEEQHSAVGQGHLAGAQAGAADQRGRRCAVVRERETAGDRLRSPGASRPAAEYTREISSDLRGRRRRQDATETPGEHRLAGPRRTRTSAGCDEPTAAISSARRARGWPRTSDEIGPSGGRGACAAAGAAPIRPVRSRMSTASLSVRAANTEIPGTRARLSGVLRRHQQFDPCPGRVLRHREGASHRP